MLSSFIFHILLARKKFNLHSSDIFSYAFSFLVIAICINRKRTVSLPLPLLTHKSFSYRRTKHRSLNHKYMSIIMKLIFQFNSRTVFLKCHTTFYVRTSFQWKAHYAEWGLTPPRPPSLHCDTFFNLKKNTFYRTKLLLWRTISKFEFKFFQRGIKVDPNKFRIYQRTKILIYLKTAVQTLKSEEKNQK